MNKRQYSILDLLHNQKEFITLSNLAEEFNVSVKTIRNDLSEIKEFLSEQSAGQIEAHPHIGIRLVIDESGWQSLNFKSSDEEKEIIFFILRYLFKKGNLTAQRLTEQYYISRNALDKILQKISDWFYENHIAFERRRGKGISIQYSEFNYRTAFMNFYTEYQDMFCKLTENKAISYYTVSKESLALTEALDGFRTDKASEIINELQQHFGITYSYSSEVILLILISLCIVRSQRGHIIQVPDTPDCRVGCATDSIISDMLCDKIESEFNIKLPEEEKKFLEFAVSISEIQDFADTDAKRFFENQNIELCQLTVKTVKLLGEAASVELKDDAFFVRQLNLLLKAVISRLKYGIVIKNQLLVQIKKRYSNMLALAWLVGNVFEKELGLEINEHEIGYLALHIGGAIERQLLCVSACVVCNYGIGVSQILKEKLTRIIPELRITSVFSGKDIIKIKNEECDFIISTTSLGGYRLDKNIVEISHLLTDNDIKNLKNHIKSIRSEKKDKLKALTPNRGIFTGELIFPECPINDKNELLSLLCAKLEDLGYVTSEFKKTVFERESTTSTDIGRGFAIPHGLSKYVNRSTAVFARLKHPIQWTPNGEKADIIFLLAFDLDESEEIKNNIIRFYKSIVSCMESEAECNSLRSETDKDKVLEILKTW